MMNYILLIVQFVETDNFLNGKFATYGYRTLKYLSLTAEEKKTAP